MGYRTWTPTSLALMSALKCFLILFAGPKNFPDATEKDREEMLTTPGILWPALYMPILGSCLANADAYA